MLLLMFLFVTDTIENYELEDYIEEILFNEFDTMVEDGSLSKVRIVTAKLIKLCSERINLGQGVQSWIK